MKNYPTSPLKIIVFSLAVIGIIALALGGYLTPVSRIILKPLIMHKPGLQPDIRRFKLHP
jgi:hypothetical protein